MSTTGRITGIVSLPPPSGPGAGGTGGFGLRDLGAGALDVAILVRDRTTPDRLSLRAESACLRDWTNQELADLYRTHRLLSAAGLAVEVDRGLTDEGDPWFVFCDAQGQVVIHLARISGLYILDGMSLEAPLSGRDFDHLIAAFSRRVLPSETMRNAGPRAPEQQSGVQMAAAQIVRLHRRDRVYLHPAMQLAALIWAVYLAADLEETGFGPSGPVPTGEAGAQDAPGAGAQDAPGAGAQDAPGAMAGTSLLGAPLADLWHQDATDELSNFEVAFTQALRRITDAPGAVLPQTSADESRADDAGNGAQTGGPEAGSAAPVQIGQKQAVAAYLAAGLGCIVTSFGMVDMWGSAGTGAEDAASERIRPAQDDTGRTVAAQPGTALLPVAAGLVAAGPLAASAALFAAAPDNSGGETAPDRVVADIFGIGGPETAPRSALSPTFIAGFRTLPGPDMAGPGPAAAQTGPAGIPGWIPGGDIQGSHGAQAADPAAGPEQTVRTGSQTAPQTAAQITGWGSADRDSPGTGAHQTGLTEASMLAPHSGGTDRAATYPPLTLAPGPGHGQIDTLITTFTIAAQAMAFRGGILPAAPTAFQNTELLFGKGFFDLDTEAQLLVMTELAELAHPAAVPAPLVPDPVRQATDPGQPAVSAGRPVTFSAYDDNARSLVDLMLRQNTFATLLLKNEIIIVDTATLSGQRDDTYARSWTLEDGSVVSVIGVRTDFEAFDLAA